MTVMLRVSLETREKITALAHDEYDGATADEVINRLLNEHWERKVIEAVDDFRTTDPAGYAAYLTEADRLDAASARPLDPWNEQAT